MGNSGNKNKTVGNGDKIDWGNPRVKDLVARRESGRSYIEAKIPLHNRK